MLLWTLKSEGPTHALVYVYATPFRLIAGAIWTGLRSVNSPTLYFNVKSLVCRHGRQYVALLSAMLADA